jgi:hypothetical protein
MGTWPPDPLRALIVGLRADATVTGIAGTRVATRLGATFPAVRLDAAGGTPLFARRIDGARIQVHAFSGDEDEAISLALAARAAVDNLGGYRIADELVVTATSTTSLLNQTTNDRQPPVYDYTFTATLTVRPDP